MRRRRFLLTSASVLAATAMARARDAEALQLVRTIPLPGVKGRFDHFACDVAGQRVIVAALGNNFGEVIDVEAGKRLHSFAGLRKPTGSLVVGEPHRIYFANGDDGTFRSFDASSYAETSRVAALDDADNVRFDPTARLIYVGYGEGALGVIDPAAAKLLSRIPLAAHPESFQLEAHGPRIFVNVPDKKHVAVIDRAERKVVATWPMEKWKANFPMALDESTQRLFIGCRQPARLAVLETLHGKAVADVEISGDTDDLFYDAKRQRLYVSCGEGFIDVIQRHDGDRFERTARIATRGGARTCFFSPELDRLFLAVPERDGHEAELRIYQP